jgi:hypothetical protein
MATQTFEKRLEKALLDAAKTGANITIYNFAGATVTGNIYINNGVPHVSKPTVEAPQKDTATQSKAKKQTKTEPTPVVVAPEVAEPVVFETESYENDEDSDNDQEEVTTETQDDLSQDNSQASQEIQVTFDDDTEEEETHVFKRLAQINKTLSGSNKIKLKKKLAKCGDVFKTFDSTVSIASLVATLDLDDLNDFDDTTVCNFKDLQAFEDVVESLSVGL